MAEKESKYKELADEIGYKRINVWDDLSPQDFQTVLDFCQAYKKFLDRCKTEREAVKTISAAAADNNFTDLNHGKSDSGKYFYDYRGKVAVLARIGSKPLKSGMKIIAAHIDSPRLDLKQNPLYQEQDIVLFKTHYYGGIKTYQWLARPLAIHGVFILKDGSVREINIGEMEDDPIFTIDDLLPHLDKKTAEKKVADAFQGEKMNIIIGSKPLDDKDLENRFKLAILSHLHDKFGISESDFLSAELEMVPAGKARDLGFDRSMVAAYGQDDRVCVYTALQAIIEAQNPNDNILAFFMDKEEIGSVGNTGADSRFLEYFTGLLMDTLGQEGRPLDILAHSQCLSADVNGAFNPDYPDVHEKLNAAKLGYGVCVTKYTGARGKYHTSDASAEFLSKIRQVFDENGVVWQTGEMGKVDEGGGGTIAQFFAAFGMEVVDCGPALLSMHAPLEIASKGDIYHTYKAYKAFYEASM